MKAYRGIFPKTLSAALKSPTLGILETNSTVWKDTFKESAINELPQDAEYQHMCIPFLAALNNKFSSWRGARTTEGESNNDVICLKDMLPGDDPDQIRPVNLEGGTDIINDNEEQQEDEREAVIQISSIPTTPSNAQDETAADRIDCINCDLYQARRDEDYPLLNGVLNKLENLTSTDATLFWNLHPSRIKDRNSILEEWEKATSVCDEFHLDMAMISWALSRKPTKPVSGMDMINWAIERDCHILLEHLVTVMGVPVDKHMLSTACTSMCGKSFGSRKTIKFMLDRFSPQPPEVTGQTMQDEMLHLRWVNTELAMAHVRQTKDYALLHKALNKSGYISSQGTGPEKPDEVYLLQVQLNVNRDDAMALCHTLGLMDAVEVWRQALGLVKERQVILSSFCNHPTIFAFIILNK